MRATLRTREREHHIPSHPHDRLSLRERGRMSYSKDEHGTWKDLTAGNATLRVSTTGYVQHWNERYGWTLAFQPKQNEFGYRRFRPSGVNLTVHWCVLTAHDRPGLPGETPDHINGDRGDNRLENLRWANRHKQQLNRKRPRTLCSARGVKLTKNGDERWFASSGAAAKFLGCAPRTVRQAADKPDRWKCKGWNARYDEPAETQEDLDGECWVSVTTTLSVSNMGRVQKWRGRSAQLRYTPIPHEGEPYAIVLVNQSLHRVIFLAFGGVLLPGESVDHIDQDATNNKLDNLRAASGSIQNMNKRHSKHQKIYSR